MCATNGCSSRIYRADSYLEIAFFLNGGHESRGVGIAADRIARTFIYITVLVVRCVAVVVVVFVYRGCTKTFRSST